MAINPNIAAAGVQGGTGLFSGILNSIFAKRRQKRQFKHDQAMAEKAYGHDLDMWNRQSNWNMAMWNLQNQYNLPANAMQRLRDAGLNPNLIAGQGSAGGQAASIQPATMPRYQQVRANYSHMPVQLPDVLSMYNNFRMANAQVDNVKAQTDLTEQKTLTEAIETTLRAAKRGIARSDYQLKSALAAYSQEFAQAKLGQERRKLHNMITDSKIKQHMVGRTAAEAGLKQMEYMFFQNLGIKGMRDIAPFLQLLLQSYRGR